jgi:soluble lytic murein transglycosylase-like protein
MQSITSNKGAKGLLQVLPSTEKEVIQKMGYELNKMITLNLDSKLTGKELQELSVGAFYMHSLVNKFQNEDLAIIAYNEGASRVIKKLSKGIIVGHNHNYLKEVRKHLVAMN